MPMTSEEMAAHKARLQIIEMLGWGPSSMASAEWIVHRINKDRDKLLLQIEGLHNDLALWKLTGDNLAAQLSAVKDVCNDRDRLNRELQNTLDVAHLQFADLLGAAMRKMCPDDGKCKGDCAGAEFGKWAISALVPSKYEKGKCDSKAPWANALPCVVDGCQHAQHKDITGCHWT